MAAFLGVEHSLTGRRWVGPDDGIARMAEALEQASGRAGALCQLLARAGVAPADVDAYLNPTLRDTLPDPRSLRDMDVGVSRFIAAVKSRQAIAIFADYDVDGGSSAALLLCWLRAMGLSATLYVPDRIDEGYGPNEAAMAELAAAHDLIICVDCGTLSHGPIAAADGADVIVLDHHLGLETLPDAVAVVNPNRADESGDLAHLCAAAIVFLFLVETNRQLREAGQTGLPDLMQSLDLVGLATVADVAPLIGVNRTFVRQGLRIMAARARPGLAALADVAKIDSAPTAHHLGYVLGPRINAGGRIGKADLGARLLSTADPHEARALAERLDALNVERREVENAVRLAAIDQADAREGFANLAWASGTGWHPGVVGIVASRLKERTHKPSIVIGIDGDIGKGSGRSVSGIDLGHVIQRVAAEGLLIQGGGHKMAAGLTVAVDNLEAAMARIDALIGAQAKTVGQAEVLRLDAALFTPAATVELIEDLELAGPYGAAMPAPSFAFADQKITFAKRVGDNHLKLRFSDGLGQLDAIAFGAFDSDLGPALEAHDGAHFHLAGRLEINAWQGRRTAQLMLRDAAPVS